MARAHVRYDADGMTEVVFTGHRISTQIWDGGRCLLKIYNRKGRLVHAWQASRVYSIDTDVRRG